MKMSIFPKTSQKTQGPCENMKLIMILCPEKMVNKIVEQWNFQMFKFKQSI